MYFKVLPPMLPTQFQMLDLCSSRFSKPYRQWRRPSFRCLSCVLHVFQMLPAHAAHLVSYGQVTFFVFQILPALPPPSFVCFICVLDAFQSLTANAADPVSDIVIQSYSHTIIQSYSPQSYSHTVIQSYSPTVIQSYSPTVINPCFAFTPENETMFGLAPRK